MATARIFSIEGQEFDEAPAIASMLSRDEKALYFDIARNFYEGRGEVYELGPWLGSGTYQICSGLEQSGHPWALTVVDRFTWGQLHADRYPQPGLQVGDSFLPLFQSGVSMFAQRIYPIRCELTDLAQHLTITEPIELLFVDAPKSWRMLRAMLQHFGPHLLPGARLVFQDFFHITSRQIIWLLMSLPALTLTHVVKSGTAAAFSVSGPLENLDAVVPATIGKMDTVALLKLWEQVRQVVPHERVGEAATGLTLDLLERHAYAEARDVLEHSVLGKPWEAAVCTEVERLSRYSGGDVLRNLLAVNAFLKFGYSPENLARTRNAPGHQVAEPRSAVRDEAGGLDANVLQIAQSLAVPKTGAALTARYFVENTGADLKRAHRLHTVFETAIECDSVFAVRDEVPWLRGRDVVEVGGGVNLHGAAMRALGATSYLGVDPRMIPEQRTYQNTVSGVKVKTKLPVSAVVDAVGAMRYLAEDQVVEAQSADLLVYHLHPTMEALAGAVSEARRILRPAGLLWLRIRNPRSWSGHGKHPQALDQYDKSDESQHRVADWRHLARLQSEVLTLAEIRQYLERQVSILRSDAVWEGPEIAMRLSPRLRKKFPNLELEDFAVHRLSVLCAPHEAGRGA